MHRGIRLLVEMGIITRAQAERFDALSDALTARVESGEMTLAEALEIAEGQAHGDAAERERSQN